MSLKAADRRFVSAAASAPSALPCGLYGLPIGIARSLAAPAKAVCWPSGASMLGQ
jgi:hypothetical protein